MLNRFPSKSRRKWYDPEDAFSDVILAAYEAAAKGDLKAPPEGDHWHKFLHKRMRQKLWLVKRRDDRTLTADAGREALLKVEASETDDPVWQAKIRDGLDVLMPKVKEVLSPKQQTAFFGKAQDLTHKEIARVAGTTPGAARVHGDRAEKKMKKLRKELKNNMVA